MPDAHLPQFSSAPERVFVSVDESTARSTVSFFPSGAAAPIQQDGDGRGDLALSVARSVVAAFPTCTIAGPHFHASATARPKSRRRR